MSSRSPGWIGGDTITPPFSSVEPVVSVGSSLVAESCCSSGAGVAMAGTVAALSGALASAAFAFLASGL